MRYQYRLTKYSPAFRASDGRHEADDWTAVSDIGRTFAGVTLTEAAYLRVEAAYLWAIRSFIRESDVPSMQIRGLERRARVRAGARFAEGQWLDRSGCVAFARLALREKFLAKLIGPGRAFIHFGFDYYVYVGVPRQCRTTIQGAETRGLYVERFRSPYLRALTRRFSGRQGRPLAVPAAAELHSR